MGTETSFPDSHLCPSHWIPVPSPSGRNGSGINKTKSPNGAKLRVARRVARQPHGQLKQLWDTPIAYGLAFGEP